MASIAKFDTWQNSAGVNRNTVLQVVQVVKGDVFGTSAAAWTDVPGLSVSITPNYSTSKILVMVSGAAGMGSSSSASLRLVRDGNPIFVGDALSGYNQTSSPSLYGGSNDGNNNEAFNISYLDSPATTLAVTYKMQVNSFQGGTCYINSLGSYISGQTYSQKSASSIILMEIAG